MKETKAKTWLIDILYVVAGSIFWAIGMNIFHVPNNIAPGGFSGIATVLNYYFDLPIGAMIALMNIPQFIISIKKYSKEFVIKTLLTIVITSTVIDVTATFFPTFTGDVLLAAIAGGAASGIGLGLIYVRDITTGGTSLLARLVQDKFPTVSYAQMVFILDAIIVVVAAVAYQDWVTALYAAIAIVVTEIINDVMLAGLHNGKLVYIISKKNDEISKFIMIDMDRGLTALKGRGCYTNTDRDILMVVVKKFELPKIKKMIKDIDKDAFIIVGDVSEIHGEGFSDRVPKN